MKTYPIVPPSLDGMLSEDSIYFEGIKKPSALFILRDSGVGKEEDALIMERYFNDLYNLFLRKLTSFASDCPVSSEDSLKLQGLLQELIKVKGLIENEL